MMKSTPSELLLLLTKQGCVSVAAALITQRYAEKWQINLFQAILDTNILDEPALARALADIFKLEFLQTIESSRVDTRLLREKGFFEFKKRAMIPLVAAGELPEECAGVLVVANPYLIDELSASGLLDLSGWVLQIGAPSQIVRTLDQVIDFSWF